MKTEYMFRVTWPGEPGEKDQADFSAIPGLQALSSRWGVIVRLPRPFDDVLLIEGEVLTPAKAERVRACARHFGVAITYKPAVH